MINSGIWQLGEDVKVFALGDNTFIVSLRKMGNVDTRHWADGLKSISPDGKFLLIHGDVTFTPLDQSSELKELIADVVVSAMRKALV